MSSTPPTCPSCGTPGHHFEEDQYRCRNTECRSVIFHGVRPDMTDGTRTVNVPAEESKDTHYHVPGGCSGHLVQTVDATAEELVSERGLLPCRANGCKSADLPLYERCDGCGKPVFDPADHDFGTVDYCAECVEYLRENPGGHGHEHYKLREGGR